MSYSLNEIEALAKRAIRGAGLSWGLAEDGALAVRWLASFDLPGPELLASLLTQNNGIALADLTPASIDGEWSRPTSAGRIAPTGTAPNRTTSNGTASSRTAPSGLTPLICGAALSDCAAELKIRESIAIENVTHPLLMLPFAAMVARQIDTPVSVEWEGVCAVTDGEMQSIEGFREELHTHNGVCVVCRINAKLHEPVKPRVRGHMTDESVALLMGFAERGFAPVTDQSRQLGAGAGLSDND